MGTKGIRTSGIRWRGRTPEMNSRMVLGTWQGIYVFEYRKMPHRREVVPHRLGE